MTSLNLEIPAGLQNTLIVPREIRDYINEQAEGRSFQVDSVSLRRISEPRKIAIDLHIAPTGAEQVEPFTVSLGFGEAAANKLLEGLSTALHEIQGA